MPYKIHHRKIARKLKMVAAAACEEGRREERERCAAIVRHHMDSHGASARAASNPYDVLRYTQAAAALETILERIEET